MSTYISSSKVPRALFVLVNLAIIGLVYVVIVSPVHSLWSSREEQLQDLKMELSRYTRLASREAQVRSLSEQLARSADASIFLAGDNGATSAALQGQVREIVTRSGLQIRSIAAEASVEVDGLRYASVNLDGAGPIRSIHSALKALQAGTAPVLFVDHLEIQAPATVGSTPLQEPTLNIQIRVAGVIR